MGAKEIVEEFIRCIDSRDVPGSMATFHKGGSYTGAGLGRLVDGEIEQFLNDFFGAFPDNGLVARTLFACGDQVGVEWTYTGTMTGEFKGIAPTGARFSIRGSYIIQVEGEKIRSIEAYWDNQELFDQLGLK